MTLHTFYSACPIIRRQTVRFGRWISLDGVETARHLVTFEREVLWVLETQSTAQTVVGDKPGDASSTYTDFYGLFTSADTVIDQAKEFAAVTGLEPGDKVRREVVTTRTETPVIAVDAASPAKGRLSLAYLPSEWLVADEAAALWQAAYLLPFDQRPDDLPQVTRLRASGQAFTVWRSDWTEEANAEAYALARAAIIPAVAVKTAETA